MEMERYHQASKRALDWCLDKQRADGSIQMEENCFDAIYKFPAAMLVMGKYVEAAKLLNWIENTTLTAEGDLSFAERKVIFDWHKAFYLYTNSWIVIGAQKAGFFRLANRAIEYILTYQNSETGDFQSGHKGVDQSGLHDTTITSNCGIACLYTGKLPAAFKAANALCNIVSQQPKSNTKFYFRTDIEGKIVKDYPEEKRLWFYVDSKEAGQLYYYLGISSALLCHIYEISRDSCYLQAAEQIFEFLFQCNNDLVTSFASGKVGYAASLLYRITKKQRYKDAALKLMEWLVKKQKADSCWTEDQPNYPWFLTYDCTAEFVFWISEMTRILSSPIGIKGPSYLNYRMAAKERSKKIVGWNG